MLSRRGRVPFSRIDNNMGNEQSDENHGDLDQLEEEELREDILRAFATEYGQTVKGKEPLPGSPPKKLPGNPAVRRTKAKRKSKKRVSKQAQGRSMDTVSSMNAKRNSKGGGGRTELGSRNKTAPNTEKEREIDKGTGEIDGEKAAFPEEETGKFVHNSPRKKAASAVISSKATRHEAHGKRTKHPNGAPAKGAKRPGAPAKSTKRPDAIATIGRFARNVIVKKEIAQRKVMQTEEENLVEDLLGEIVGIDVAILVQAFNKLVAPPTSSSSFRENKGAAQGQANGPPTPENDGGRVGKVDAAPAQSDNSKAFKMMLGDFSGDSPEKDSHAALKQWRVSLAQKRFHSSKGPSGRHQQDDDVREDEVAIEMKTNPLRNKRSRTPKQETSVKARKQKNADLTGKVQNHPDSSPTIAAAPEPSSYRSVYMFPPGQLGLALTESENSHGDTIVSVEAFLEAFQSENFTTLSVGHIIERIGSRNVIGLDFEHVVEIIKSEPRPCEYVFRDPDLTPVLEMAPDRTAYSFAPGSLGIGLSERTQLNGDLIVFVENIVEGSQSANFKSLKVGHIIEKIGSRNVIGLGFDHVIEIVERTERPCDYIFRAGREDSTAGGDGVVSAAKPSANTKLHSRGSPDRKNNKLSKSTVLRRRQMMKNIKNNNKIEMAHTALKNALRKQKDRVGQPGEDAAKKRARQKAAEGFKDALHQEQQKVGKEVEKMEILILLKRLGLRVNPLYIDRPIDFRTLEESSEIIINKFQSAKKPRKSKANSGGLDAKEKKLEAEKGKLLLLKEMEESGVDISVTTATARDLEIMKKKKSQSNDRLAHVINIQRIFRKNRFRRTINTHLRTRQRSATCIQRFWHLMVFRRERRTMCVRVQRFWRNFQWVEKQSARSNVAVIRQRAISNWVGSNNSFIDPHMNASSIYNLVNSAASKIQRVRRQQLLIRRFRNIIADGLRKKMRNSSGDEFLHASRHYIRVSKMWKRSLKPVTAFKDQMQAAKGNVPAGRTREGHSGDVSEVEKYKSTWTFLESIIVEIQAFYRGHLTRRWVRKWKTAHSRDHEALLATKHVKVNVVGGKGFKKRDSFCKVYAHGIFLGKTNVCKNSTNPVWNKKPFHADFLSGRDIYLEFEVIARSKLGIQTFLGRGSIYAAKCFGNAKNTLTLVTKAGKKQKYNKFVQGSLTITVSKPANRTNQGANRRVKTARSKIVALQALLRGYLQRGKWSVAKRNSLRAIQLVQAKYRCVRLTRKYQQFRKSAVLCQTIVRGHIHQTRYIIKRGSAICLQQFVRCHLCRSHFNTMWSSTVTLQSLARRGVALKRYTQTRNCARRLQSWVRSKWANTKYKCLRRGVVLLQLRYKFNWKDYFKQFKHRIRSLQRVFRNFQIVHRARRIQTWYRHLKEGLKSVLNIYKYLKFYIMEENVARVQALFRGKRTRRTLTRMRSEDRAFRACYECLKPKLTSEIVSRYVEFERIWTNRQYYRDIHLPLIRIEIPYRMEIMETRRRESIEGGIMVEAHRNLCALKIQCRFRSFATRKRFAGSADDYEPTPENTDGDDTSVYSGREDSSDESLSERDTLSLGSEEEQQLDVDAIAITFPPGSDVWVASPRLFEAEGAYHGVVEKYETSEDGTVLYVVHFDDGDVVYDIGIGGDRLYHDDPRATPNVEDTHILEEEVEVEVEVEEEEEEKEEEKKEEEGGVEEGEGVEEEEEEEEEIEEVKEVEKEDVKEENNVEKEEKIGEEGIIPHGGGLEEGGGGAW